MTEGIPSSIKVKSVRYTPKDKCQSREEQNCSGCYVPKNGIHGGLARCNVSRYSAKFLVLVIKLRIVSSVDDVLALT